MITHWVDVVSITFFYVDEDDYQNVDSIIALAPMEQVLKYEIVILDDQRVEKLEVFSVILEIAPGQDKISGLTLGQPTTDIFIKDNDCEPKVTITIYTMLLIAML